MDNKQCMDTDTPDETGETFKTVETGETFKTGEPGETAEDPVARAARDTFGIEYLYPWQRLVVANILDAAASATAAAARNARKNTPREAARTNVDDISTGGDMSTGSDEPTDQNDDDELFDEDGALRGRQIILLPTGTGKSLCFQVPALFLDGPTLVIYPLLALMGDQLRRMIEAGLDPALFRGSQSKGEREAQFRRLEGTDGRPPARLVIANPEVLIGEIRKDDTGPISGSAVFRRIAARKPAHIAIDEAHCVSEWGDTFRPAYLALGTLISGLDPPAVTAFTATASPQVLARVSEVLFAGSAHVVRSAGDRPNIVYSVVRCRAKESALVLEASRHERPMVIFCATRGGTERTAKLLRERLHDRDIRFYHAGLQKNEKLEVESWFHGHRRAILVTTCAWGMGVDKKDVRSVIHRDPSPTAEAYIQEAGRGGRDGTVAEAVLLWSADDEKALARNAAIIGEKRAYALADFARGDRCRRTVLLEALGDPAAGKDAPGGEATACSGCDVCSGKADPEARDEKAMLAWLSRNERSRTLDEAAEETTGIANRSMAQKYGVRPWSRKDAKMILKGLIKDNKIEEIKGIFWKGRLKIVRSRTVLRKKKTAG